VPSLPTEALQFVQAICDRDGVLTSNPEYVRSIPEGMKNAIDWLVSGDQIVGKPTAPVHTSHRGDDMLKVLLASSQS
jgi:NAD(P)H-dependent FMN reductase